MGRLSALGSIIISRSMAFGACFAAQTKTFHQIKCLLTQSTQEPEENSKRDVFNKKIPYLKYFPSITNGYSILMYPYQTVTVSLLTMQDVVLREHEKRNTFFHRKYSPWGKYTRFE